jgi:hypothetical protein
MMWGGEVIHASLAAGSVASWSVLQASLPPCSVEANPGVVTTGASPASRAAGRGGLLHRDARRISPPRQPFIDGIRLLY